MSSFETLRPPADSFTLLGWEKTFNAKSIRARNLPYSVNDIKKITKSCKDCCKLKYQFHKLFASYLIKANQSFEHLNINLKGPVLTAKNNVHMLIVLHEFSKLTFTFPCKEISTETVKNVFRSYFRYLDCPILCTETRAVH